MNFLKQTEMWRGGEQLQMEGEMVMISSTDSSLTPMQEPNHLFFVFGMQLALWIEPSINKSCSFG